MFFYVFIVALPAFKQKRIEDPVKHLLWSYKPLNIFTIKLYHKSFAGEPKQC